MFYKVLTIIIAIAVLVWYGADQHRQKKEYQNAQALLAQMENNQLQWQALAECIAEVQRSHFHVNSIGCLDLDPTTTNIVARGFAFLNYAPITDDAERKAYRRKIIRAIARKMGCKETVIPFHIVIYTDFTDIIPMSN